MDMIDTVLDILHRNNFGFCFGKYARDKYYKYKLSETNDISLYLETQLDCITNTLNGIKNTLAQKGFIAKIDHYFSNQTYYDIHKLSVTNNDNYSLNFFIYSSNDKYSFLNNTTIKYFWNKGKWDIWDNTNNAIDNTETNDYTETVQETTKLKEKQTMTTNNNAADFFKECVTDGFWRSAGDNATSGAKTAICNLLRNKGADDSMMEFVGNLLDSKEGEAFVAGILSVMLFFGPKYMPMIPKQLKNDPRINRMAKEFGTKASAEGMNVVMREATTFAMPIFTQLQKDFENLPPVEKTRIESETELTAEEEVLAEEEAITKTV